MGRGMAQGQSGQGPVIRLGDTLTLAGTHGTRYSAILQSRCVGRTLSSSSRGADCPARGDDRQGETYGISASGRETCRYSFALLSWNTRTSVPPGTAASERAGSRRGAAARPSPGARGPGHARPAQRPSARALRAYTRRTHEIASRPLARARAGRGRRGVPERWALSCLAYSTVVRGATLSGLPACLAW